MMPVLLGGCGRLPGGSAPWTPAGEAAASPDPAVNGAGRGRGVTGAPVTRARHAPPSPCPNEIAGLGARMPPAGGPGGWPPGNALNHRNPPA